MWIAYSNHCHCPEWSLRPVSWIHEVSLHALRQEINSSDMILIGKSYPNVLHQGFLTAYQERMLLSWVYWVYWYICRIHNKSLCTTVRGTEKTNLLLDPLITSVLPCQERFPGSHGKEPSSDTDSFKSDSGNWNLTLFGDDAGGTIKFVSKNCRMLESWAMMHDDLSNKSWSTWQKTYLFVLFQHFPCIRTRLQPHLFYF